MSTTTRDRILIEAERIFAEHGFAGTRVASIAAAVDLGNAGLLHHFPSKAALYRAVLESIADELDARTTSAAQLADPMERLRELLDALLSLHQDRPAALSIVAHEFLDRSGRIDTAGVLPLSGIVRATVAALEDGQREGSVRPGDVVAMAAALHGAVMIGLLGRPVYERASGAESEASWTDEVARSALIGVAAGA